MIEELGKSKKITLYIDIHNHSRKKNIFSYGCTGRGNFIFVFILSFLDPEKKEYIWPLLMSKLCPMYSLKDSMFIVTKDKECTARVAT